MKLTLRLPDELYERLKELADKEHRSLNAQIVYFLGSLVELQRVFGDEPPPSHQADTTPPDPLEGATDVVGAAETVLTEELLSQGFAAFPRAPSGPPLDAQGIPPDD